MGKKVLPVSRRFSVPKPLSQIQRSTFSTFQMASYAHSFGGFGIKGRLRSLTCSFFRAGSIGKMEGAGRGINCEDGESGSWKCLR